MLTEIHDGWTVSAAGGPGVDRVGARQLTAAVPGCVHLDLLAAGEIPDPYLGQNEAEVAWVGRTDWTYSTVLDRPAPSPGERVHLVAEGLDTVAEVRLDGARVGRVRDMHRTHRFDVTDLLVGGPQRLEVAFSAPLDEAERASARLGDRPHVNHHPFNALRKSAYSFGWDWGPDLPTTGIWRRIGLESWRTARLESVRARAGVGADGTGLLEVDARIERDGDAPLRLEVRAAGQAVVVAVPAGAVDASALIEVPDVAVWWPRGYGDQPLHDVEVRLLHGDDELARRALRVGFRTVAVRTEEDAAGTSFAIEVNGQPVLVRGYNWIPDDSFLPRVPRERYEARIREATGSNANLLRVWGGGIYESDDFYDVCDELGVLVWQDFLFACASYAEEPELAVEVEAEARDAVTRLSSHPSLALWCGGNECLWGHEDWDWKEPLAGRTWGTGYYHGLLPSIVAELDPGRPYIPGSPYSPAAGRHPNDPAHGPMHIWDVWNDRDYTAYLEYAPRFVSEFGFQGPPTWSTLTRALDEESLDPWSPAMLVHQKAEDGNGKLERGLGPHLPAPTSFEDWHWATSLNQARAVRLGVEHFRSLAPHCTGAVVWQLNDCWPVVSWAAVDGDGRRKPLWYALRHAFADRCVTLLPDGDGVFLGLVNDTAQAWDADVRLRRTTFTGEVVAEQKLQMRVAPRSAVRSPLLAPLLGAADDGEVVVADVDGLRALLPRVEDVASQLPAARLDVDVRPEPGGVVVVVRSDVVVRDLALLVDRVDPGARVDEMLVSLLPGEEAVFHVTTEQPPDAGAWADPRVLRCANQLAAAARAAVRAG